jgi:hypothetical protein
MSISDLQARLAELADALPPSRQDPAAAVIGRVRRHRRRVWGGTAAAMVVVLVAATTALVTRHSAARPRHVTAGPAPAAGSATAQQLSRFHWSSLPAAPIQPRSDASVVWTGRELVVWGGVVVGHTAIPKNDGAALDPASNRWRPIAEPTSVAQRWAAVTVWTGQEMLVIGGQTTAGVPSNDAAYEPNTDQWRVLPPRPPGMTGTLSGEWDGREALVVSTSRQAGAYDPAANQWRALPPLPEPPSYEVAWIAPVWADNRLLVWAEWSYVVTTGNVTTGNSGIDLWSLDPSSAAWTKLKDRATDANGPGGVRDAIWTGTDVLLPATQGWRGAASGPGYSPGMGPHGYRYERSTNSYRPIAHGPVDDGSVDAVWTGAALIRTSSATNSGPEPMQQGNAAAWDPGTDTWTTLPPSPVPGVDRKLVWTGRELVSYGQDIGYRFGP